MYGTELMLIIFVYLQLHLIIVLIFSRLFKNFRWNWILNLRDDGVFQSISGVISYVCYGVWLLTWWLFQSISSFFSYVCDGVWLQTLHVEQSELASQLDHVRDSAVTLMSRSAKYHHMVEPQLTALNQHWEEVAAKIKVSFTQFL